MAVVPTPGQLAYLPAFLDWAAHRRHSMLLHINSLQTGFSPELSCALAMEPFMASKLADADRKVFYAWLRVNLELVEPIHDGDTYWLPDGCEMFINASCEVGAR